MYNYCIDGSLAILCPSVTSQLVTDNEKVVTVALVRASPLATLQSPVSVTSKLVFVNWRAKCFIGINYNECLESLNEIWNISYRDILFLFFNLFNS